MSCGVPVVGVNESVVTEVSSGFLLIHIDTLSELFSSEMNSIALGYNCFNKVKNKFCLNIEQSRLLKILQFTCPHEAGLQE